MAQNPTLPVSRLLERLKKVKGAPSGWSALCPAHADSSPSLSVSVGQDGDAIVACHCGCTAEEIVAALGMTMSDLFREERKPATLSAPDRPAAPKSRPRHVATFAYTDEDGMLLFEACRFEFPLEPGQAKPKKQFRQRVPDGKGDWVWSLGETRRVIYRLPEVIEAAAAGRRIFVTEGEKHADALAQHGYPATTNPMGALKWTDTFSETLRGCAVVVLPDNDDTGRDHAQQVAVSLHAHGCRVQLVALPGLPEKGDVVDWLADGGSMDALEELIAATPCWTPDELEGRTRTRWRMDELVLNEFIMRPPQPVVPRLAWAARSTILAGREKLGKSTLMGYITARVTRGEPFLDSTEACQRGDVLLISLEEYIGDTLRRLQSFGANETKVHIVDRLLGSGLNERVEELRGHIDAVTPALVIIDSLSKFSMGLVDEENSSKMGAIANPLSDIAHDTGAALMISHHARKSDGRARGHSSITAAFDVVCEFIRTEEQEKSDPTMRRMLSGGRVPVPSQYDFSFDGREYALAGFCSEQTLEERILTVVRSRPGCSARDVRSAVTGKETEIIGTMKAMVACGKLWREGESRAWKLYLPKNAPARMFGSGGHRNNGDDQP
jgi:putative DNA primase/helicase